MRASRTLLVLSVAVMTGCPVALEELRSDALTTRGADENGLSSATDRVWFASNVGSTDLLELFRNPDAWSTARSRIHVMQFYAQQLVAEDPSQCPTCGENILPRFIAVDAFRKLEEWGIGIAVEMGSVKHHTCDPDRAADFASHVIRTVERAGGRVRYIAMDEPYIGGEATVNGESCGYSMRVSAEKTAHFIRRVEAEHPGTRVGDIEPYPYFRVHQLQAWVDTLLELGVTPAFFHLDVDRLYVRNERADVRADLRAMKRFLDEKGIPLGNIYWGHEGELRNQFTDRAYYDSVLGWVRTSNDAIGAAGHNIFQSWAHTNGRNTLPNNLPEAGGYGHLRLLVDGTNLLFPGGVPANPGGPAPPQTPPPGDPPSTPAPDLEEVLVRRGYLGILGRPADDGGALGYVNGLRSGQPTAWFTRALFDSGEFAANRAGLSSEELARELYRGILDREADEGGLVNAVEQIAAGRRVELAAGMLDSAEFRERFGR